MVEGFAVTPYKNETPSGFIPTSFVCFSRYEKIEEMGYSFKNQFLIDDTSKEALDKLYTQLTANESDDDLKVKNIVNYVQDSIVYQNYGLLRVYQPSWCIQGNRGDCKAKTLIAIELLKRVGIEAQPVLVNLPKYYQQLDSIPSGFNFNHVIVQFDYNGEKILLDPTITNQTDKIGAYTMPAYEKGLVLYDNKTETIDISAEHRGKVEIYDEISDKVCLLYTSPSPRDS